MKIRTKGIAFLLVFVLAMSMAVPALADGELSSSCTVIGADLTEDEVASVYGMFGIDRGSVPEMSVTNSEERQYLEGKVDESMLGSLSISCVYIQLLDEGEGLSISCQNISWCTVGIYENALVTAGITDARVIVAAPFAVSGTAALTGIYKAYETMTGTTLDEDQKDVAVDEMITTGQLAEAIGSADATELVNQLKAMLNETANMTDEELRSEILAIAGEIGVTLTEDQISQLITLVRQMEKLDTSELMDRVQEVQNVVSNFGEATAEATGFFAKLVGFFDSIANFFNRIFGGL